MSKIKFGWAEVDITPKKGQKIGLAGQFFERITDEVESPISVTALTIDSGSEQVIMCSCDLVSVDDNLNKIVKEMFTDTEHAETHFKEFIGHTPLQVFVGAILGIVVAILMSLAFR